MEFSTNKKTHYIHAFFYCVNCKAKRKNYFLPFDAYKICYCVNSFSNSAKAVALLL